MTADNRLTREIEELAMREGAAHIGFGPVERYAELPRKCGPRPTDVYPAAKTVVSMAVQMPDACMERAAYHKYDDPESGLVN
ncbi:MAG: hypothetical protein PHG48_07160, partial [Eubacteriales bacterium]|nr:hypothetical protein [Eubacteriales bacterium]